MANVFSFSVAPVALAAVPSPFAPLSSIPGGHFVASVEATQLSWDHAQAGTANATKTNQAMALVRRAYDAKPAAPPRAAPR